MRPILLLTSLLILAAAGCGKPCPAPVSANQQKRGVPMDERALEELAQAVIAKHDEGQRARLRRGLDQLTARWRPEDGDAAALRAFVLEQFVSDPAALQATAGRLEYALEMIDGHANEVRRELSRYQALDEGPLQPIDGLLAAYSPTAHINEDLFKSRIAFVALLNFPLTSLAERLKEGPSWSRQTWALARLTERFEHRLPASVLQQIDRVNAAVEGYIDGYNIHAGRLVGAEGPAGFPDGLKLISHWGLRDEIKAQYQRPDGLDRQRLLATVIERIIRQEIPAAVIDSDKLEWDPLQNRVREPGGAWREAPREADLRYAKLLQVFAALRQADPYFPELPTHIRRAFERDREMPEQRLRQLLESVLLAPEAQQVAALVKERLGRPLEPFDLWYAGFRTKSNKNEEELDAITRRRYPNAEAFQRDLPRLLGKLGFAEETALFLSEHIAVDAARGAGHAYGAKRREDKAHLRTRIGPQGMDYKGFNIAIHELGHNVEQVFSMSRIDHTLLEGVPNTGFTEAFAFLFQARDLELLGQAVADPQGEALQALNRFWSTFEIAGVAILDMEIWHWMYDHPQASPAELRQATVELAQQVWNRYYAPVFEVKDAVLPAIYSHIIGYGLYTPDYPLGFLITSQLEAYLKERELATEMERVCRQGRLVPDIWMQQAVGSEVSSAPLLSATRAALGQLRQGAEAD